MGNLRWEIIFEDEDILVVDKPSGMLSIADRYKNFPNLADSLRSYRENIFVNHRLDKETSGLLIFSKNEQSHRNMQELFQNNGIKKFYRAIVKFDLNEESGTLDKPIFYDNHLKKAIIHPKGKKAITYFRTLKRWQKHSYLELRIETGRTHQIRCHLADYGHPILADPLYGDGQPFLVSEIKKRYVISKGKEERPLLSRTALHAAKLEFKHPETHQIMTFEADLPKDMKAVVQQLEKWTSL